MLEIQKQYVLDEQQRTLAVQIPIAVYNQIEEILEDFGLVKLMEEVENDERLSGNVAYSYYQSLKTQNVGS
jgi:RelB Antitoxin alpha helical domain